MPKGKGTYGNKRGRPPKKKVNKKANKRATQMARDYFNSGKGFGEFLRSGGYIERQKKK